MDELFDSMSKALEHLRALNETFVSSKAEGPAEKRDLRMYSANLTKFKAELSQLEFPSLLYGESDRQMILGDLFEYFFFGRGYYTLMKEKNKPIFFRLVLHFVNLLMTYEVMTVSSNLRGRFLEELAKKDAGIASESRYEDLRKTTGQVGLPLEENSTKETRELNKYFDTLLPKTAGGLWHELLVYLFLLRNDYGYVIPLLLSQRLFGLTDYLVPPDFLILGYDKRFYGVEVGRKKEIQSGSFSLKTAIPTASLDTENSRSSDRCPICKRWIQFCDVVIDGYSNLELEIENPRGELRCLDQCTLFSKDDIASGKCPYTKYQRQHAKTLDYANHEFATGLHYHYECVLNAVPEETRNKIVAAKDKIALKTHYPFYSGLEVLSTGKSVKQSPAPS